MLSLIFQQLKIWGNYLLLWLLQLVGPANCCALKSHCYLNMKIPSLITSLFLTTTTETKSAFVASNNNDITSVSNSSVTLSAPVIVIPASDNQFQVCNFLSFNSVLCFQYVFFI